jgi:hypothetical protein
MNPGTAVDADIGRWHEDIATIFLNKDEIGTDFLKTTISHELRHALDDYKSGNKVNKRYNTPKNKELRGVTNHPTLGNVGYTAQPIEINARFLQVMDDLTPVIKRIVTSGLSHTDARTKSIKILGNLLTKYQITQLFKRGTDSPDYKRIIKRAVDFIDKEIAHLTK